MSTDLSPDRKKAVCTTLVGVIKASPLAGAIDTSALFMHLMSNFAVVVRDGVLDLGPLWDSLAPHHDKDALGLLFSRLADAGRGMGLQPRMPPHLDTGRIAVGPRAGMPPPVGMHTPSGGMPAPRAGGLPAPRTGGLPAPGGMPVISGGLPSPGLPAAGLPAATNGRAASGGLPGPSGGSPPPRPGGLPPPALTPANGMPSALPRPSDMPAMRSSPPPNVPPAITPTPLGTPRTPIRLEVPREIDRGMNPTPRSERPAPRPREISGNFEEYQPTPMTETALAGIPDEQQRRIVSNLVGALKATDAGPFLSAPQLSYFIASRFHMLCDGQQFFFQAIYDAVLELDGVEEKDVYQAALRFRPWLARIGIALVEPAWKLDQATRTKIEEQSGKVHPEAYGPIAKTSITPEAPKEQAPATAEARAEQRLKKWGLVSSKHLKHVVQAGIGVLLIVIALVLRSAFDPVDGIDNDAYAAVFPSQEALMFEGKWMGVLDEARWKQLPLAKREKALRDLTDVLKRENKLLGARIVHPKTRVVIGYDLVNKGMVMSEKMLHEGLAPPPAPKK